MTSFKKGLILDIPLGGGVSMKMPHAGLHGGLGGKDGPGGVATTPLVSVVHPRGSSRVGGVVEAVLLVRDPTVTAVYCTWLLASNSGDAPGSEIESGAVVAPSLGFVTCPPFDTRGRTAGEKLVLEVNIAAGAIAYTIPKTRVWTVD